MEHYIIELGKKISSDNASEIESRVFNQIDANSGKIPVFDASELEYISSSGLRILMRVQKLFEEQLTIENVNRDVYEIFEITGFTKILNIKKKMREFSVEGCKVIGKGASGTVYRIDNDTVVKVYNGKDTLETIKHETDMAKVAFIHGIPTAISYDIVKVGDQYGSVFEMLNARTFNDLFIENPDKSEELFDRYVNFVKLFHEKEVPNNILPSAKEQYKSYADLIYKCGVFDEEMYKKVYNLISSMKDDNHLLHGDFHLKNIMVVGDELMIIDMDTLSHGNGIFDFAGLYTAYILFEKDDPGNTQRFFGISKENAEKFWEMVVRKYYSIKNDDEYKTIMDKITILASVCFMKILNNPLKKPDELTIIRNRHTIEELKSIIDNVESLD